MAEKQTTANTNILPNNPMKAHNLLEHLKQVKGDTGWYEFNLKCLVAAYPTDKVFKGALAEATKPAKVTPASDATTGKKGTTKAAPTPPPSKGNTEGKKTAAQIKAEKDKAAKAGKGATKELPGEAGSPEEVAAELANIK
jgi:hypothetical protein